MSYDIYIKHKSTDETYQFPFKHTITGGTYAVGGTSEAWLNITWNYSKYFYEVTDGDTRFAHDEVSAYYADGTTGPVETEYGIRGIYGKSVKDGIELIKIMIDRLRTKYPDALPDRHDYWASTAGNAIAALDNLMRIGLLAPWDDDDLVWDGD